MKGLTKELQEILDKIPGNLPLVLSLFTGAAHMYNKGYPVQVDNLVDDGLPGCSNVFTPILLQNDETGEYEGYIKMMVEVRMNMLLTIQQVADECNVDYRTIQRWRDSSKIPVITTEEGKQLFPVEIVQDYAAKMGHIKGRLRWR